MGSIFVDLHLIGTLPEMHLGLMIQTMESVLLVYAFGKSTDLEILQCLGCSLPAKNIY